jgi:hypothetical protein
MELDSDHINGRCAAVSRVVEEIASQGDSCVVGVLLLWAIVDTDSRIHDVVFAIMWNVFVADENNSVGTCADTGHALSNTPKFLYVGFAPQFLVLGVHEEVQHFHEMACGFVKDSVDHVSGVLLLSCVASRDRAACCFAIIVDTGQQSLLSYCTDLGLTAGVACRTIHQVYLVIQYSQVGYLLGLPEFCEWGDGTWGMIWHVIGVVGVGVSKCLMLVL